MAVVILSTLSAIALKAAGYMVYFGVVGIPCIERVKIMRVNVRAYYRFQLEKWEHVCAHTRQWPTQLSFRF